jgi:predicted extracellular nuclease
MVRNMRALLIALATTLAFAVPAAAQSPTNAIVISEFRARGPAGGNDEFVELRNRSAMPVSIAGYQLAGCAAASGAVSERATVSAGVTLEAGQAYLFVNNAAGGYSGTVPGDQTYGTGFTDFGGTNQPGIRILDATGATVDGVGSPMSPCREGTGFTTPGTNGDQSFERVGGTTDTDNNVPDFTGPKPGSPQNRASTEPPPGDQAPQVTATTPTQGQNGVPRDSNVTVTFSEPVDTSAGAFTFRCGGTDVPFTFTADPAGTSVVLDPQVTLPSNAACTVTIAAGGVSDRDTADPPDNMAADYTLTFQTQESAVEGLRIHDIQGRQHLSPFNNALVAAVPGVVTALRTNGFYYQDPQPDADPRTSEGIFVFTSTPPAVVPGEAVTVSGRVTEFRPGGGANLTITEIISPVVTPAGTGTIAPTIVGRGGRVPPNEIVDNDTIDPGGEDPTTAGGSIEAKSRPFPLEQDPTFDPEQDGIDFHESLEGMLTQINNAAAVGPTSDFGSNRELPVVADGGAGANVLSPRGTLVVRGFDFSPPQEFRLGDFNPERLILNDARDPRGPVVPLADTGDRFRAPVRAVVDYSFGNFKYLLVNDPPVADGRLQPERTRSRDREDELAVASYNVENLDGLDPQERYDRIARQVTYNLRSPDILSLEEVQDNDGAGSPAPSQADVTYSRLIEAIRRAGGPVYDYRQIDPTPGADGGEPGGNIRVAFLFRTDRRDLRFVDRPGGNATTPTEPVAGPGGSAQLTLSPGRVDPTNPVWSTPSGSRKPLAGEFRYRGRPLFLVGNHFSSKGGDDPVFGRFQEPARTSENQRRGSATNPADTVRGQAGVVNAWVRRLLNIDRRARVVVLGDLNDFDFSETLRVVEEGDEVGGDRELVNLFHFLPRSQRYTYVFQGNAQVLDHILVSPSLLLEGRPDLDVVHINAEFFDQASDHDPPITRLRLDDDDDDDDEDDDDDDEEDDD